MNGRNFTFLSSRSFSQLGIATFVFVTVLLSCTLAQAQSLQKAPVNPAFEDYRDSRQADSHRRDISTSRTLGWIPSPVLLPQVDVAPPADWPILRFTTSYDLRSEGRLTPVRNQLDCGACWTFATYSAFESYLMPSESTDFSENHMKNTHGFDNAPCDGGQIQMSSAYLARWGGPINETDDPYNDWDDRPSPGGTVQKHVHEILWLPDRTGSLDNDAIKSALINTGAVMTTMRWEDDSYNSATQSYYYSGSDVGNHGVAIVGWDDNYSSANFSPSAPGNGAFLIRNSWGADFGLSGYFYISYYDSVVGSNCAVYKHDLDGEVPEYDNIYSYDPLGMVSSIGYGNETAYGGNVFTAERDETIGGVGFFLSSAGSSYTVSIYTSVTSNPTSGNLVATKSGSQTYAGFYTVDFRDEAISVTAGEKFAAVVKYTTPENSHPVPIETYLADYSSAVSANANESFISYNGTAWIDLNSYDSNANITIKVFTDTPAEEPQCDVCDDSTPCPDGYECVQYTSGDGGLFCVKDCTQGESCPSGSTCYEAWEDKNLCAPNVTASECQGNDAMYTDSCGFDFGIEDCADDIDCTTDSCIIDGGFAACLHESDHSACQDGLYCNGEEICDTRNGCEGGTSPDTDDGISCTADSCEEGSDTGDNLGTIVHTPNSSLCQNGLFCDGEEICDVTQGCIDGEDPSTEDDDLCTEGTCLEGSNLTDNLGTIEQRSTAADCLDGLYCNGAETCDPSLGCQDGVPPNISDGISCTVDICHEGSDLTDNTGFLEHDPDPTACQDGLYCNGEEVCSATQGCIAGTAPVLGDGIDCTEDDCYEGSDTTDNYGMVLHHENSALCQDGLFCNGEEICNANQGCIAGTAVATNDGIDCTLDGCTEGSDTTDNVGVITHTPNIARCQDGLYCNGQEICDAVQGCLAGTPPDTNDGIPCTVDRCDEGATPVDDAGAILHEPDSSFCQNGLFCDGEEICDATQGCIAGTAPTVDDGIICTDDSCREGSDTTDNYGMVLHYENPTLCQNGLFCDGEEVCNATQGCIAGTLPNLDDGIGCTVDSCSEGENPNDNAGNILHSPQDNLCNDSNSCTTETCNESQGCVPEAVTDGTLCTTTDSVSGTCMAGQCISDCAQDNDCDDGLDCTEDRCDTNVGQCRYTPVDTYCNDSNSCTTETCDILQGCLFQNVSDGMICTTTDNAGGTCQTGQCVSECANDNDCNDDVACTVDQCDITRGACSHQRNDDACNDDNPCTEELCDVIQGCLYNPVEGDCDDGLYCTVDDLCVGGECQGGSPLECGGSCLSGECSEAAQGCTGEVLPDGTECDDGNLCTIDDACQGGTCEGQDDDCDNDNPCTEGHCDPDQGCMQTNLADWTACTPTDSDYGFCFDGLCEPRAENDVCDQALTLELDASEVVELDLLHSTQTVDTPCYSGQLQGPDAYFRFDSEVDWTYSIEVSTGDNVRLAAALWGDCPDADGSCLGALESTMEGETVLLEDIEGDSESYVVQILVTEGFSANSGQEFTVTVTGEEIVPVDGDEEMDDDIEEAGNDDPAETDLWEEPEAEEADLWEDEQDIVEIEYEFDDEYQPGDQDLDLPVEEEIELEPGDEDDEFSTEDEFSDEDELSTEDELSENDIVESTEVLSELEEAVVEEQRFSTESSGCTGTGSGSWPGALLMLVLLALGRRTRQGKVNR